MPGTTKARMAVTNPNSVTDQLLQYTEASAKIFSPEEIKNLKNHRYSSTDGSLLSKVMNPWWSFAVTLIPTWVAPNILTLIGLLSTLLSTCVLLFYCPGMDGEAPRWVYVLMAVCIFMYQTMDALDGKQAKRTNTGSVMGELLDHGCDSVSTILTLLGIVTSLQLGTEDTAFRLIYGTMAAFYLAHWQAYVTGGLEFGMLDVTEGQVIMIIVHLVTAFFGPSVWRTEVLSWMSLRALFIIVTMIAMSVSMARNIKDVILHETATGRFSKNADRYEPGYAIFSLVILTVGFRFTSSLWEQHPVMLTWCIGIVSAKLVCRLIISHMGKSRMVVWDKTLTCLLILLGSTMMTSSDDYVALLMATVYATVQFIGFAWRGINQLAIELNLPVLTIPYPNIATLKEKGIKSLEKAGDESYFSQSKN
eukprot:CFRG2479T1